jgi:hypothetical protein
MDRRYEAYCLADPFYYDHPAVGEALTPGYAHTRRPAPDGWSAGPVGDWWRLLPARRPLPDQGWKIHVSATPASAPEVLDVLWDRCIGAGLAFKFLRTPGLLFLRNSKYADRGSSGKFAAVYPADESELEHALALLDEHLSGRAGPYILSDLRHRSGPLYVRYGGFAPRRCVDALTGETVPAIADPDGRLVPDVRGPVFAPPAWAPLPGFLVPDLEARRSASVADLPYRIERALHFSNGGGVYQGTDTRSGETVVLKEARPHAGLLGDGRDALARLEHERDMLLLAAGSGAGPRVLDWVEAGEHRFLVLEHIAGRTLNTLFSERYPLIGRDPAPAALEAYTAWALEICGRVERLVGALHAHGVVFGDLHLFNVMVRPDDTVALIDFEVAAPAGERSRRLLAARAFQPPAGLSGPEVDRYALACLRLALFLPLTALLPLDRSRARALAEAIRGEFPAVPAAFLDDAVATIIAAGSGAAGAGAAGAGAAPWAKQAPAEPGPAAAVDGGDAGGGAVDGPLVDGRWPRLRAALAEGIARTASPERTDRLFPGDIRQFAHPGAGLGVAHGAAGVLYALHAAGAEVPDEYEHWLLRRTDELPADARLGFYDGIHGIAHVLDVLGHRESARRLLERALAERWRRLGPDLEQGLAGIGLNLLHFAARTGETALREAAFEAGRLAVGQLAGCDARRAAAAPGTAVPGVRAGLMRGASGPALLFLRLYEQSGDDDWLARARAALRLDLAGCVASEQDGSLRVNEGWRALPYLAEGSAGIALVARRYLVHREDALLRRAIAAITLACTSRFYAQAGLFAGRAGVLLALADADLSPAWRTPLPAAPPGGTAGADGAVPGAPAAAGPAGRHAPAAPPRGGPDAQAQVRRLAWHAVDRAGALAFPGDQLHRLSADLATGAAGVLLALGAVHARRPAHLPFLGPPGLGAPGPGAAGNLPARPARRRQARPAGVAAP